MLLIDRPTQMEFSTVDVVEVEVKVEVEVEVVMEGKGG
jgi:hypothetical protein